MSERDKLRVTWSKRERDLMFHHPSGPQTRSDGHLLHVRLNTRRFVPREDREPGGPFEDPSFVEELKARGYDVTTLRFSIAKDLSHPRWAQEAPVAEPLPAEEEASG